MEAVKQAVAESAVRVVLHRQISKRSSSSCEGKLIKKDKLVQVSAGVTRDADLSPSRGPARKFLYTSAYQRRTLLTRCP